MKAFGLAVAIDAIIRGRRASGTTGDGIGWVTMEVDAGIAGRTAAAVP